MRGEIDTLHKPFMAWLRERQVPFVYHRPDRKSGIHKGHPDFTILWMSRVVMIEFKTIYNKLSPDQVKRIDFLRRAGNKVEIARSVAEAIEAAQCILCTSKQATAPPSEFYGDAGWPLKSDAAKLKQAVDAIGREDGCKSEPTVFVGDYQGATYVFAQTPGIGAVLLRKATPDDLVQLPRGT